MVRLPEHRSPVGKHDYTFCTPTFQQHLTFVFMIQVDSPVVLNRYPEPTRKLPAALPIAECELQRDLSTCGAREARFALTCFSAPHRVFFEIQAGYCGDAMLSYKQTQRPMKGGVYAAQATIIRTKCAEAAPEFNKININIQACVF